LLVAVEPFLEVEGSRVLARVSGERDAVRAHIVEQLGVDAAAFATGEIMERLIDWYFDVTRGADPDAAMYQLGHALEGFVKKIATIDPPVVLPAGARMLGQVARELNRVGRLNSKHYALVTGLTGLRNAADHTADAEIGGQTWYLTSDTVIVANQMMWRLMRSFFAVQSNQFEL
jgi:hypothetical protein